MDGKAVNGEATPKPALEPGGKPEPADKETFVQAGEETGGGEDAEHAEKVLAAPDRHLHYAPSCRWCLPV